MANNNGLNVLDAVTAAKLGKGTGGSGGVTKKYVDDGLALKQDKTMSASVVIGAETETTVEGAIGELADLVPSTAAPTTNKLATAKDVNGEEIIVNVSTSPVSTASGNLRKITIYGKSEVVDGSIVSAGEGGSIEVQTYTGTNQFGGLPFATALNNASRTSTIDTVNKTVTYNYRKQPGPQIIYEGGFKPNTQYTVLLTGYNTSKNESLLIEYTDGTDIHIEINAQSKTTVATVSAANKTIKAIMLGYFAAALTTLYYDECGIFEGVKTASDFEPYNGTMATFTTALPLRSTLDRATRDELIIGNGKAEVITRCEVVDDNIVPLATPVTTPLTTAEISAFRGLKTFAPQTNVTISDDPEFEVEAYAGTANGRAVSELEDKVQKQIEDKITVSPTLTLAANGWSNNTQTVTFAHDTTMRNVIDITPSEVPTWAAAGVYASAETSTGITFTCATVPETALTFKVTSMEVS